jgi:hypothetical protein
VTRGRHTPESVEVIREGLRQWQARQNKLRRAAAKSSTERELIDKAARPKGELSSYSCDR